VSEERFRLLANNVPDVIYSLNGEGNIVTVNSSAFERYGYTEQDAKGNPFLSFVHPEDREIVITSFLKALEEQRKFTHGLQFRIVAENGISYWFELNAQARYDSQSQYVGEEGVLRDITLRKQAEVELQYTKVGLEKANKELQTALAREQELAHTDSLTGINNRRHLYELAEHEFEIALRYQQPFSILMFDIDHFKRVNDTFGHTAGDRILQQVTQVTCAKLRSADVIGRYGGEEFVIILPMTNAQQAYPLAERIRLAAEAIRVPTEKGDAAVTLSIGIVEIQKGAQTGSVESLIRRADEVMYAAKQAGRNRTEIGD